MDKTIKTIVKEELCTGCGVCSCVCPNGAITIETDNEGFLSPIVDKDKCTDCGLCKNVCSASNITGKNNSVKKCYAVAAEDDIRRVSSSGGVFTLLAKEIFKLSGYVCGVSFNSDWSVQHIIINDEKDLDKLRRSKYVQSFAGDVYSKIKELLEQNNYVLFSGTPCQVSALKNFLNKDYEKLLTLDIVCHGVPSYNVFKKFLQEQTDISNITDINFREKEKIGLDCFFSITTKSEKLYPQEFFGGFVENLYLRKCCTSCKYIGFERQGDITIGDFWNIEKYEPEFSDKIGTSLVLVNNDKGELFLNKIKNSCIKIKETSLNYIEEERNPTFYRPNNEHKGRKRFFELIKKRDFYHSYVYSCYDKYDIGLVGCGFANNYGAILTNYALYKTLNDLNYEVLMIDKPKMLTSPLFGDYIYGDTVAGRFMRKYLNVSNVYNNENDLQELNEKCDMFLAGSDQIWGTGVNQPCYYYYFLDWVKNSRKKIAYASSFGTDKIYYDYDTKHNIKYLLSQFDGVSVREDTGVKICEKEFGIKAEHNLDPVFITDKKHYDNLILNSDYELKEKEYIASYILDAKELHINSVKFAEEKLKLKSYNFADLTNDGTNLKSKLSNVLYNANPETFLKVFKGAKCIITNSFHGVCFAIIFNKPFICIPNISRGYTRFYSLLSKLNMTERFINSEKELQEKAYLLDFADYTEVNNILDREKEKSLNWLINALTSPKKDTNSSLDYIKEYNKLHIEKECLNLKQEIVQLKKENHHNKYKIKLILNKKQIERNLIIFTILKTITFNKNKTILSKYSEYKSLYEEIKFMKEFL